MKNTQNQQYVKSFSKGQITIPKKYRDILGLGDIFWLKLNVDQNKIIAEPLIEKSTKNYPKKLLKIKSAWFSEEEIVKNRKNVESRLNKNG